MPVKAEEKKEFKITEDIKKALKDIVSICEKEDEEIRKSRVRRWQKAEQFWQGFQHLFWSERENSWIAPQAGESSWRGAFSDSELEELDDQLGSFYDFVIDIYKAHGESIVAALAAQVPALRFLPDDADDTNDVSTARCYSKIADVISRHNKIKLSLFRALYFLYNCGLVASYVYKDADEKYGTYQIPKYTEEEIEFQSFICPDCDTERPEGDEPCPTCGSDSPPKSEQHKEKVPKQEGETTLPKTRVLLDLFGPLHFKVSEYARNQKECWYLINYGDFDKSVLQEELARNEDGTENEELWQKIEQSHIEGVDRIGKTYSYEELETLNLSTRYRVWLRCNAFNKCPDKKIRKELYDEFPKGCKIVFVGKEKHFVSIVEEDLDDRWRIGQAGLCTFIHSDPTGRPAISLQEMRNQVVNLVVDIIDHIIPTSYADKEILSFNQYGKYESLPGFKIPVKPRPGKALADSFHEDQRTVLPPEVGSFIDRLDHDAQFSLGDFPSVFGGPSEGQSRTYAEYEKSRQQAMQRLSILWNLLVDWFCLTMENMVRMYVTTVVEDQKFVSWDKKNEKYINTWIRQSELQGRVGGVESEASEAFPLTLAQKHDVVMHLVEMNNPQINSALYEDPANARVVQDVLALNEIRLPGERQRIKQVIEISQLIKGEPIQKPATPDPLGMPQVPQQPQFEPSVPIDPDVDDDDVHIKTLIDYLIDDEGMALKEENPQGYSNCVAHLRAHREHKKSMGPPPIPVLSKTPKKVPFMAQPVSPPIPPPRRVG